MDKIEFALESFKNNQNLIKYIDQKSAAVLVIVRLIFTGFISFLKDLTVISVSSVSFNGVVTFIAGLATLISLSLVVYISFNKVLKPCLVNNYKSKEYSLFYFEHLSILGKEKIFNQ